MLVTILRVLVRFFIVRYLHPQHTCPQQLQMKKDLLCWNFSCRSSDWWDTIVSNFDDSDWLYHFRMRRAIFQRLLLLLG